MLDDMARITAFRRRVLERTSTRTEPFEWGVAFFNDDFAVCYDANLVWVERSLRGVDVTTLASEIDRAMGGSRHRNAEVVHDADGTRVALGLAEHGYTGDHALVMAHRREPDREPDRSAAEELDHATIRPFLIETNLRGPSGRAPGVAEALADQRRVLVDGAGCRFFAQRIDGRVAGACELFVVDGVAQVESVSTLEEFRGLGVARNVVLRAVREARDAGAEIVFLLADLNDWPQRLYGRLGFDEVGRGWSFTRWPQGLVEEG
jgi:ribosomal protein S18 acetylase RimI-like enzyme